MCVVGIVLNNIPEIFSHIYQNIQMCTSWNPPPHSWAWAANWQSLNSCGLWHHVVLWGWKQHGPLKCWYPTTTLHGVTM